MVTEDIVVDSRVAEAPILPGQCRPHLVAAMEEIVVDSRVAEALILPAQCQAHLVAAVPEADTTALPRVVDRTETTLEADRMAVLLAADTVTTK